MRSIRRDLLVALLGAITAVLLVGAFATYRMAREEADALFDYQLRQLALSLRDQAFRDALAPGFAQEGEDIDFVIQVWDREGVRLYLSHPHKTLPERVPLGFATIDTRAGRWRVFATQVRGQTIQVAQPMSVRDALALSAALRTVAPFLILLPVLGALIWMVVGRGLFPLGAIARAVTTRTPAALDPLPEQNVPLEIRSLVHALNDLLGRLKRALDAQRAFIADAAHELRTPLTALQLQVQLTERAKDERERSEAVAELKQGLQRATHSVRQLLTLAREEPGAAEKPLAPVNLAELARLVIAEHVGLAEAKGLDLGASTVDDEAIVTGDFEALRILLGNLVENAIRYTPPGGTIDVAAGVADGIPFADVSDSGPGIPTDERQRVFDRFYRRPGTAEPGSGLGLAIVKAIADRHGADVTLDDAALGGLRVRVDFPPENLKRVSAAQHAAAGPKP